MSRKKGKLGNLLGDGARDEQLSVSEKYAKKYNEKKDRIEAARAAQIFADEDVDNTSEESTEDENADLLTQHVESKIFDTLTKIKAKDPSIYQSSTSFFDDEDFKDSTAATKADKPSMQKMTYKNFIRTTLMNEGADAIAREEEDMETKKRRKTPAEEQRDLQDQIRQAAGTLTTEEAEGDDLFSLKEQSLEERQRQDEEFAKFQSRAERKGDNAEAVMANYWRGDEDLDENERFLRDYVINRQWLETDSLQQAHGKKETMDFDVEDEEDEHLGQADEFEKEYNFRFEVEEGKQIQSHARFPENSVRDRNEKRKRQRKERADRKEAEKVRRAEELKRLKNLKKQEIKRRLEQIREVTGNEDSILGPADLDDDFDPSEHDQTMAKILGKDYDEKEETLTSKELVRGPDCNDLDVSAAATEGLRKHWGVGSQAEAAEDADVPAATEEWPGNVQEEGDEDDEEVHPDLWFLCDGCQKPIPGGKHRFDCKVCDNFTLCTKCFRVRRHPHSFVRRRVPESCMPPEDVKGTQVAAGDTGSGEMLEEYFQLDYEDIIGGDLPTRFKYRKVQPKDYGIPAHVILSKTGKELNRMVSIKKLRPYREEGQAEWESHGRGRGKAGAGRGRRGRGRGEQHGEEARAPSTSSKSKLKREASAAKKVSSSRIQAYNLENDKFARRGEKRLKGKHQNEKG